jgi:hypothetical protein
MGQRLISRFPPTNASYSSIYFLSRDRDGYKNCPWLSDQLSQSYCQQFWTQLYKLLPLATEWWRGPLVCGQRHCQRTKIYCCVYLQASSLTAIYMAGYRKWRNFENTFDERVLSISLGTTPITEANFYAKANMYLPFLYTVLTYMDNRVYILEPVPQNFATKRYVHRKLHVVNYLIVEMSLHGYWSFV